MRDDALKAHLVRQIAQNQREGRVVFDHQDERLPGVSESRSSGIAAAAGERAPG